MHFNFAHSESGASTIAANVKYTNFITDCSHKKYKWIAGIYMYTMYDCIYLLIPAPQTSSGPPH